MLSSCLPFAKTVLEESCFLKNRFSCFSEKNRVIIGVAAGAFFLFAAIFCLSRKSRYSAQIFQIEKQIASLLPQGQILLEIEEVKEGFSNALWKVKTKTNCYMFRLSKTKSDPSCFIRQLEVSKRASYFGLSPQVVSENVQDSQVLLEYVEHVPWPPYQSSLEPYKLAMKVLRPFHDKMQPGALSLRDAGVPAPFELIFSEGKALADTNEMPSHFLIALEKVEIIFDKLKPWLERHVTFCHGDFHKGNVLLPKGKTGFPLLIDFDSASRGDPFFDVVKFSVSLPKENRLELFSEYLRSYELSLQELAHFELMDMALLMVIAIVGFQSAKKSFKVL